MARAGDNGASSPETPVRNLVLSLALAFPLLAAPQAKKSPEPAKPKVKVTTNLGAFTIQLEPGAAPITVENFLKYVRKGQYANTLIHRVAKSPAVIQGGGHNPDMSKKPTDAPIKNEADLAKAKGFTNKRGTVAMARESLPDSAKAQFFVNVKDNPALDFKAKTLGEYGYCVFGKVVQGMEVVDKISKQPVGAQDAPKAAVVIQKVEETK